MDRQLKPGDTIQHEAEPFGARWTVIAVFDPVGPAGYDMVRTAKHGVAFGRERFWRKIVPVFEVGKRYATNNPSVHYRPEIQIVYVNSADTWAVGKTDDGSPWIVRHIGREEWKEVS